MPFQPEAGTPISIDGVHYRIAEHPAARGMPYGQEGRQAIVYQLIAGEERRALKVFKPRFRLPTLVTLADRLAQYGTLPGLDACRRTVLTARRHTALLQEYPDLIYAVLMPWIEGPTWMEVLLDERELTPEQSLHFAHALADILSGMQEEGTAHCDLSGPNLLLPALAPPRQPTTTRALFPLQLVDFEQMFGPELDRPRALPTGSQGYAHKTAPNGLWEPNADRFAGAILLAEMLGWCDERVRKANWGENYFDPDEMQQQSERYNVMTGVLRELWGAAVAELFDRAWHSETLDDCPTFGEWFVSLPDSLQAQSALAAPATPATSSTPLPTSTEASALGLSQAAYQTIKDLVKQAETYTQQGYLGSAIALLREAQSLAPERSRLELDLSSQVDDLELRVMQGEEARVAPEADQGRKPAVTWTSFEKTGPLSRVEPPAQEAATAPSAPTAQAVQAPPIYESRPQATQAVAQTPPVSQPLAGAPGNWYAPAGTATAASFAPTAQAGVPAPPRRIPVVPVAGGFVLLLAVVLAALALGPLHPLVFGATSTQSSDPTATAVVLPVVQTGSTPSATVASASEYAPTDTPVPTEPPTETAAPQPTQESNPPTAVAGGASGQTLRVNGLAFSRDGSLLASALSDNTAQIIRSSDRSIERTLSGHSGSVTGVAFSPDGTMLATSSADQSVILWNVSDGSIIKTLKGHTDWVTGVAFSPTDGNLLATSSNDGTIRLWDVAKGTQTNTLQGPTGKVLCVAFSPDGKKLAAGSADKAVWLWQMPGAQPVGTLEGATGAVLSIAFTPDSKGLAAGSADNHAYYWDSGPGQTPRKLEAHQGPVNTVGFSTDGRVAASGSDDGYIKLWSTADGSLQNKINDNIGPITSLAFSPDGKLLAAGTQNGQVRFYGLK